MARCHASACSSVPRSDALNSPRWRRALWIALVINAGFFVAEVVAGAAAGSTALQADALDSSAMLRITRSALALLEWRLHGVPAWLSGWVQA
jgi:Co/Zn/Cd efflux system component